ncbi:hypothetical protein [Microbacterium sp. SLBN-111]|uniref:hypothetical protein n=1 Tax=Microbacterium sp. SLBN-111 TaxID=3377733 RepID=UPI003C787174
MTSDAESNLDDTLGRTSGEPAEVDAGDDIELITDGEGLVVLGDPAAVAEFTLSAGVPSLPLDLDRLSARTGSALQAASEISANAGRWMKLTEESARAARNATFVRRSGGEFVQATTRRANGQFTKNLQFVTKPGAHLAKPGALLTNPAVLAGVGGLMAQYAMQKQMEEITDYLARIDAKVDDVLRSQKDAVLADMIGVEMMLDEALTVRAEVGRVSEVTWSKIQGSAATVARTQAYALRQLQSLADKLEREAKIGELADLSKAAQTDVGEWLAVLARCFQLQEGMSVLELDRVLDSPAEELDRHRAALQTARQRRRDLIGSTTTHLVARMDAAAIRANAKVLLNPKSTKVVVGARNTVASNVTDLHATLGLSNEQTALEARRWSAAVADVRDDVLDAGKGGLETLGRFSGDTIENARQSTGRLAERIAHRLQRSDDSAPRPEPPAEDRPEE